MILPLLNHPDPAEAPHGRVPAVTTSNRRTSSALPNVKIAVSVVIPAHNESASLPATLAALAGQDVEGRVQIVVVPNGCDDATAAIARSWRATFEAKGWELIVRELEIGQKASALNAGDALADEEAPRVYLDADVILSQNALSAVLAALAEPGIHLAAPRVRVTPGRSRLTRSYASFWQRTPYVQSSVLGAGFYAVSAEGRRRWGEFPDILADDKLAQIQFERHERRVCPEATFDVRIPDGLRELASVRGRWLRGTWEIRRRWPQLAQRDRGRLDGLVNMTMTPAMWPKVGVVALVMVAGHVAAWRRMRQGTRHWERAHTTRGGV